MIWLTRRTCSRSLLKIKPVMELRTCHLFKVTNKVIMNLKCNTLPKLLIKDNVKYINSGFKLQHSK